MHPSHENAGPSTLSLHADDPVNVVNDVAPPLHVATTFRYPDNPDELVPVADAENVRLVHVSESLYDTDLSSITPTSARTYTLVFLRPTIPVSN